MIMKKNIFRLQQLFLAILMAGAIVSCDKDNDLDKGQEFTPEELAEMAAADKFAAANSVYRALALIDELPDNWESATYAPAEGVPVDEANADVRNVVSTGADQAKSYFLSIVPDEGLNGDTWSHEGVGSLTYRAVKEENCYAVIDVNLVQMPGLKQLRFVPESVVGENKWQGTPYYGVGDVVKDKKGIYWICVRPSGGPLAKDNAYFVSFDKSLIKTYEQKQDMYQVSPSGKGASIKLTNNRVEYPADVQATKWVYAKNLVEERIALAAAHVFSYLAKGEDLYNAGVWGAEYFMNKATVIYDYFNPRVLSLTEGSKVYYIAYGSYKSSSKKNTQVKYIQPIFSFCLDQNADGVLQQAVIKAWPEKPNAEVMVASDNLMSLTDTHDPFTTAYYLYRFDSYNPKPFVITDYTLTYAPGGYQFEELAEGVKDMFMPEYCEEENIPLVMTQMKLKDHGKPASGYELVHPVLDPIDQPDYWGSLENTVRLVFEKGQEGQITPIAE